MKRVLGMMRKEFLQIRSDKRLFPLIIIAPIIQIILLGYATTIDVNNIPMVVQDDDRSHQSRLLADKFRSTGYFNIIGYVQNEGEGLGSLDRGKARIYFHIPSGFSARIRRGDQVTVQAIADGTDANTARISLNYATQIILSFSKDIVVEQSGQQSQVRTIPAVIPEPRVRFNQDLRSANFMIPGVMALILMIVTGAFASIAIVREKEIGTMEQLLVTPLRPYEFILGKLIPFTIIGFIDVILVISVSVIWFDIPLQGSIWLLFAFCGLFVITTLGFGLFASTVAHTQQQALLTSMFMIFFPSIMLSGFTFPIDNMPVIIQYVSYLIPVRYVLEAIRGIFLRGVGLETLYPQAIALIALGTLIMVLSIMRFRKTLG